MSRCACSVSPHSGERWRNSSSLMAHRSFPVRSWKAFPALGNRYRCSIHSSHFWTFPVFHSMGSTKKKTERDGGGEKNAAERETSPLRLSTLFTGRGDTPLSHSRRAHANVRIKQILEQATTADVILETCRVVSATHARVVGDKPTCGDIEQFAGGFDVLQHFSHHHALHLLQRVLVLLALQPRGEALLLAVDDGALLWFVLGLHVSHGRGRRRGGLGHLHQPGGVFCEEHVEAGQVEARHARFGVPEVPGFCRASGSLQQLEGVLRHPEPGPVHFR
ncbi:hypothetical protein EYF80_011737 [Liparis tanakae]|uniref:Uncharacterized protein n=1 Tax=Liparis tanakae TaxID=230148 RepID=A0A4Z2IKG9_9TELE|nr:hypothetical protein EYF80_011737 [Liparis tanakae]